MLNIEKIIKEEIENVISFADKKKEREQSSKKRIAKQFSDRISIPIIKQIRELGGISRDIKYLQGTFMLSIGELSFYVQWDTKNVAIEASREDPETYKDIILDKWVYNI